MLRTRLCTTDVADHLIRRSTAALSSLNGQRIVETDIDQCFAIFVRDLDTSIKVQQFPIANDLGSKIARNMNRFLARRVQVGPYLTLGVSHFATIMMDVEEI